MIKNLVSTRIPTRHGEFTLYLYAEHGKEHLALVIGDVAGHRHVPVRVHSECLTGDIFGSRRCDCGDQLHHTLQFLGRARRGILIYLRQEGRGIGLLKKMEAYNLQDQGLDTVEANLRLGHQPDERDYGIAARILRDLGVHSIRLITNNPHKVETLQAHQIEVESRIPIEVGHHADNLDYLRSKAQKMAHLLDFRRIIPEHHEFAFTQPLLDQLSLARSGNHELPYLTLIWSQTLDGFLKSVDHCSPDEQSKKPNLLAHLRSAHDALLIDADSLVEQTVPLTERFPPNLKPVLVDAELITPEPLVEQLTHLEPVILTSADSNPAKREKLIQLGAHVFQLPLDPDCHLDLREGLHQLARSGIHTLLVENGDRLAARLLNGHFVNYCVFMITPCLAEPDTRGPRVLEGHDASAHHLNECHYQTLGTTVVGYGPVPYE